MSEQAPIPQAQAVPVEAAATQDAIATPEASKDVLSPKYAALARKEKEIRRMRQELEVEKQAVKAKAAEFETNYIPKDRLTKEGLQVLLENGVTYEQLTQWALNQPGPQDQALMQQEKKLSAIEQKLLDQEKRAEETQKAQYDQAVNQIRTDLKALVSSNDDFETIRALGVEESVVELITETYQETQTLLSIEDAARQVEEYLVEEALKMAALSKVKAKLLGAKADTEEAAAAESPQLKKPQSPLSVAVRQQQEKSQVQAPPVKTLTNAQTATTPKGISSKERRERAILAFKGQLN